MSEIKNNRLNLYDFFGFPDQKQRDEAKQVFNMDKMRLIPISDENLWGSDTYFEQYNTWSHHISNFSSRLGLHFLLMYYQYKQNPLDVIDIRRFQSPGGVHKIYFDTFAEDTSLYLISYFDKHLEMFSDLYSLKQQSARRYNLSRRKIIDEMQKIDILQNLANEYRNVEQSKAFIHIKKIRDNFVHNQSSSYFGMNVRMAINDRGIEYASYNSTGISTDETYIEMCELIHSYEQLCETVNSFFNARIEEIKQEELQY